MLNRRKFEIVAFERERIVRRPVAAACPVCGQPSELLTTRQAAALLQVRAGSVRRWLAQGLAHGVRTPGGQYRVCRRSLFNGGGSPCVSKGLCLDEENALAYARASAV